MRTGNITNSEEVFSLLNPQQKMCWDYYTNPKSDTFGNAYRSGIKAGYKPTYSRIITQYTWFKNRLLRINLLSKAEKVIDKTLDMETMDEKGIERADLLRVQADTAKFIAKTLGKNEGYSERSTGEGSLKPIIFMPSEFLTKYGIETNKDGRELLKEQNTIVESEVVERSEEDLIDNEDK